MQSLEGKVAIVTGSGRGIGRAIALRLAKEKAKLVINAKKGKEECEETLELVKSLGAEGVVVLADVSTREGAKKLIDETINKFGRIDILVNNAGLGIYKEFLSLEDNLIDKQLQVSLKSAILCSQEASKFMQEGVIINISSVTGIVPSKGLSVYSIAKAGLISLTKALAIELAPKIRVNAVAPGVVKTKMGESLLHVLNISEEEFVKKSTLLHRLVEPEEVAEIVVMLIKLPSITGETIIIDAGSLLKSSLV